MLHYRERKNTNCVKWDGMKAVFGREDLLPVWVADMDFACPACVQDALSSYIESNVHGYYDVPDSYYEAFRDWELRFHGYDVKREWIRFAPGVVPAIYWLLSLLTEEKDAVCVMTPVYYPFMNAVRETGRTLVDVPLQNKEGIYTIDFEGFERALIEHRCKAFILCSPHNPVGRVWTADELTRLLDLCRKHHVYVIADEIHHDLICGDRKQHTAATLGSYDSILVTLTSASKTFNLAGMQNAIVLLPDAEIREAFDAFAKRLHFTEGNAMAYVAVEAAYRGGRQWLEELLSTIRDNERYLRRRLARDLPAAIPSPLEGTYLLWIDLRAYLGDDDPVSLIAERCGLAVDYGSWFGGDRYNGFLRVNLATDPSVIEEVADRLARISE